VWFDCQGATVARQAKKGAIILLSSQIMRPNYTQKHIMYSFAKQYLIVQAFYTLFYNLSRGFYKKADVNKEKVVVG